MLVRQRLDPSRDAERVHDRDPLPRGFIEPFHQAFLNRVHISRIPLDLVSWTVSNSHRRDIQWEPGLDRFGKRQAATVLPPDERPVIKWNGKIYSSLSAWRSAAGKEQTGSLATGMSVDPKLNAAGSAPTLNDTNKLETLTQYLLKSDSPLINAAGTFNTPFAGYVSATLDYFGHTAIQGGRADLGTAETR